MPVVVVVRHCGANGVSLSCHPRLFRHILEAHASFVSEKTIPIFGRFFL